MMTPKTPVVERADEVRLNGTPDSVRADALASSIAMLVGTLSLPELERLDAELVAILRERHSWARHEVDARWHLVDAYEGGSVATACRGRWSTSDAYDTEGRPPRADRCEACQRAYEARQRVSLGLRELRDAPAVSANAATPGVLLDFEMPEDGIDTGEIGGEG